MRIMNCRATLTLVILALIAGTARDGFAQTGPTTPKKNHHKNPANKGSGGSTGASGSHESIPGAVWFVPGQKATGHLMPARAHRIYFEGMTGTSVTFELESSEPGETTVQLVDQNNMPIGTFAESDDGMLVLRDRKISKTGVYSLLMRTSAASSAKVTLTTSCDWGLEIEDELSIRRGQSRVFRIAGGRGRVLDDLDLICDDPDALTLEWLDPLGDAVRFKSSVRKDPARISMKPLALPTFGDYELRVTVASDADDDASVQFVGALTQKPPPKATISIP